MNEICDTDENREIAAGRGAARGDPATGPRAQSRTRTYAPHDALHHTWHGTQSTNQGSQLQLARLANVLRVTTHVQTRAHATRATMTTTKSMHTHTTKLTPHTSDARLLATADDEASSISLGWPATSVSASCSLSLR